MRFQQGVLCAGFHLGRCASWDLGGSPHTLNARKAIVGLMRSRGHDLGDATVGLTSNRRHLVSLPENLINKIIGAVVHVALEGYHACKLCDPHAAVWWGNFWRSGVCDLTTYPKEKIGLFVAKKDAGQPPTSHRGLSPNETFKPPPSFVRMVSTEGLGRIETPLDCRIERHEMFAATADVKDYFHSMKRPRWMHPFSSLSPLTAQEVHVVGRIVDGIPLITTALVHQHKRHSASRCCEDSPHDNPSCLCGSFEDQVLAFGV